MFPFSFGLTNTTFSYDALKLGSRQIGPDEAVQVSIATTNTGQRTGKESMQLSIRDEQARLVRPEKELKAFAKVQLDPREGTFSLGRDALAYFDDLSHEWIAEAGVFELLIGASSQDIRTRTTFTLTATTRWAA